mgnify:FL=1
MPASSETTTLHRAGSSNNSFRTTVPLWAVRQLGLKAGTKLRWRFEVNGDEMILKITPVNEVSE